MNQLILPGKPGQSHSQYLLNNPDCSSDFKTKKALRKYYLEEEKQQTALNKTAEVFIIL